MPHITAAQHAQHLAELERLTAKGYTITATLSGYKIEYQGKELICAIARVYPPEVHAEQFGRNFLSAALTIAREHAGEVTREEIPPLHTMAFDPVELRLIREGLLELLDSIRDQPLADRKRDKDEEERVQALYLRFT